MFKYIFSDGEGKEGISILCRKDQIPSFNLPWIINTGSEKFTPALVF